MRGSLHRLNDTASSELTCIVYAIFKFVIECDGRLQNCKTLKNRIHCPDNLMHHFTVNSTAMPS